MQPSAHHTRVSVKVRQSESGSKLSTEKMPKVFGPKSETRFKPANSRAAYPKVIKSPGIDRAQLFDHMATAGGINCHYKHHAPAGDILKKIHTPYPVPTDRQHAKDLEVGALLIDKFVRTVLKSPEKFWKHVDKNCPAFGLSSLITHQIADQLHNMYVKCGVLVPAVFDVMLTTSGWRVVEAQTACGYLGVFLKAMSIASGLEDTAISRERFYAGSCDPRNGIVALRAKLVQQKILGKDDRIYVVDVDALSAGMVEDKRLLAKRFVAAESGDVSKITNESYPVEPLDLCKIEVDATGRVYFPEESYADGKPTLTGERVYPKAVFCRATPYEIISLVERLKREGQTDKARAVCGFFTNHDIKWVLHPAVYTLVDKASLKDLGEFAKKTKSKVAKFFPKMFSPGETVPPGSWVVKDTDGNSGVGVNMVRVLTKSDALKELPKEIRLKSNHGNNFKMSSSVEPGRYEVIYPEGFYVEPAKKVDQVIIVADDQRGYKLGDKEMAQERFEFRRVKMEIEVPYRTKVPKEFGLKGRAYKDDDGKKWQVFYIWGIEEHRGMLAPSPARDKHSVILAGRRGPMFDPEETDFRGRPTKIVKTNVGCAQTAFEGICLRMRLEGKDLERVKLLSPVGIGPLYVADKGGRRTRKSRSK